MCKSEGFKSLKESASSLVLVVSTSTEPFNFFFPSILVASLVFLYVRLCLCLTVTACLNDRSLSLLLPFFSFIPIARLVVVASHSVFPTLLFSFITSFLLCFFASFLLCFFASLLPCFLASLLLCFIRYLTDSAAFSLFLFPCPFLTVTNHSVIPSPRSRHKTKSSGPAS